MRAHIVDNGVIVNTVVVDSLDILPNLIDADLHGGSIGDLWDGEVVVPKVVEKTREEKKAERQATVEQIKVTTASGKTFDGDEISQGRMARGILGLQAAGAMTVTWVLADNTPTVVTAEELWEALALAGAAQAAAWVID